MMFDILRGRAQTGHGERNRGDGRTPWSDLEYCVTEVAGEGEERRGWRRRNRIKSNLVRVQAA